MKEIACLSFVAASISFTITETKLFKPLRERIKRRNSFFGKLISCGYCFGFWIALLFVPVFQPRLFKSWWLLDYFLTALVISWVCAFQWILMCWLMEKAGK